MWRPSKCWRGRHSPIRPRGQFAVVIGWCQPHVFAVQFARFLEAPFALFAQTTIPKEADGNNAGHRAFDVMADSL